MSQTNAYNAAAAHYERQQQKEKEKEKEQARAQESEPAQAAQKIETIYTTVESEPDRTDWLTVVSNLRQSNRQLVEEIARLEQTLASTTQSLHSQKEKNQSHEITILQHQDELRIAHDRLGGLFQQLETSHQIGQRQQTLVETLSQQLELVQAIVPQLEAENEEITEKYHQQAQKLAKTEQLVIELHRRLQSTPSNESLDLAQINLDPIIAEISDRETITAETPIESALAELTTESKISIEIEPALPQSRLQMPHRETPRWSPAPPTNPATTILSPPNWREEIPSHHLNHFDRPDLDPTPSIASPSTEIADKESTSIDDPISNWPAPTLNRDRINIKTAKIDLPNFPKR